MRRIKFDLDRELKWQIVFNMLSIKYRDYPIQFVIDKTNEFVDGNK